jgi:hypothetical protein
MISPVENLTRGDVVQLGQVRYEIQSIEELYYMYQSLSIPAASTSVVTMTDLKPEDRYIYWISGIGINGLLQFQLYYPRETPRNAPTGNSVQPLDMFRAHWLNPAFLNFFIPPATLEPVLHLTNALPFATTSQIYFYGLKLLIRRMAASEQPAANVFVYMVPNYLDQNS